jgi:hypothetical protein
VTRHPAWPFAVLAAAYVVLFVIAEVVSHV